MPRPRPRYPRNHVALNEQLPQTPSVFICVHLWFHFLLDGPASWCLLVVRMKKPRSIEAGLT